MAKRAKMLANNQNANKIFFYKKSYIVLRSKSKSYKNSFQCPFHPFLNSIISANLDRVEGHSANCEILIKAIRNLSLNFFWSYPPSIFLHLLNCMMVKLSYHCLIYVWNFNVRNTHFIFIIINSYQLVLILLHNQ